VFQGKNDRFQNARFNSFQWWHNKAWTMAENINPEELAVALARTREGGGDNAENDNLKRKNGSQMSSAPTKKKREKKLVPLPPQLLAFRFEHKENLAMELEADKNNKEDPQVVQVARCIDVRGDPNSLPPDVQKWVVMTHDVEGKIRWDLSKLRSEQIRQLTANFGARKHGSATNCACRLAVARHVVMQPTFVSALECASSVRPQPQCSLQWPVHDQWNEIHPLHSSIEPLLWARQCQERRIYKFRSSFSKGCDRKRQCLCQQCRRCQDVTHLLAT